MVKTCAVCGEEFDANHPRQKYCRKEKVGHCIVCGKEYIYICAAQHSRTCGNPECAKLASSRLAPTKSKVCRGCGKEFIPKSYHSFYCGDTITGKCSICGKEFHYKCEADAVRDKCPHCRHLYKKTCICCGKEFITSTPQKQVCDGVHYKVCPVCGKMFVVNNDALHEDSCCSVECSSVRRSKSIHKALSSKPKGYNSPKTVHLKICKVCGQPFETNQYNKEICDRPHIVTCEVCGKEFTATHSQLLSGRLVCSSRCASYKAVRTYMGHDTFYIWQEFLKDPEAWIRNRFEDCKPTYNQLSSELGVATCSISQRLHDMGLTHLVDTYVSTMEQDVISFIRQERPDLEILHNDRTVLKPREIDIYLPELKFGIECNPTCSHNSSRSSWIPGFYGVPSTYHRDKSIQASKQGVFLLHLFGYEWNHKQPIMKSMIKNLLGCTPYRLYARQCVFREVSYTETISFLNENHRQGFGPYKYSYGLYYKDELVSIMTFSPPRHTISSPNDDSWELVRFCSKLDHSIAGGASKLFHYFVDTHSEVNAIKSFADVARSRGNIYEQLGFRLDHVSSPGYMWVNSSTDEAVNRIKAQKQNIRNLLKDADIDMRLSEAQIMENHGFVKVYDSGVAVWMWRR